MAEVTVAEMMSWTRSDLVQFLTKPFTLANGDCFDETLLDPKDIDLFTSFRLSIRTFMTQTTLDCYIGTGLSMGASLELMGAAKRFCVFEKQEASRQKRPASDDIENSTKKVQDTYRKKWKRLIDDFYEGIDKYPTIEQLCDPSFEGYIAWPSMAHGKRPTHRFTYKSSDAGLQFRYFGRTQFSTVYQHMLDMLNGDHLFLSGSLGTGKSHIVAAAVGAFLKERRPVVFIPDCSQILSHPVGYIARAMLTALHDDKDVGDLMWKAAMISRDSGVNDVKLRSALGEICHAAWLNGKYILFVYDQTNALDHDITGNDRVGPGQRETAKEILDFLTHDHSKFSSSTPNYRAIRHDQKRGTAEDIMKLRLGMDAAEVNAFWNRYSAATGIELSVVQKERVEFLSGRLPILLTTWEKVQATSTPSQALPTKVSVTPEDFSIMEEQFWHSEQVALIRDHITTHFSTQSSQLRQKEPHMTNFVNTLIACVHGQGIDFGAGTEIREIQRRTQNARDSDVSAEHLDLRYFFLVRHGQKSSAGSSCGVAQIIGMEAIRKFLDADDAARIFNPKHILTLIPKDHNPCSMGFIVEKVIIAFYTLNGMGSISLAIFEAGGPLNPPPAILPPNSNPSTAPPIAQTKKQLAKMQSAKEKQSKPKFDILSTHLRQLHFDCFPPPGAPPTFETARICIPMNPANPATDFVLVARVKLQGTTQVLVSTSGSKPNYKTEKTTVTHGLVVGVQVTTGKDHRESDVQFYTNGNYEAIKKWMDVDKLTLGFLWITEKPYSWHSSPTQKPVGGPGIRANSGVEYTNYGVTVDDLHSELGAQLAMWRREVAAESTQQDVVSD